MLFFGQNGQGTPYFGFYCIFINKFFFNLPGGSYDIPLLLPPPLFSFMYNHNNMQQLLIMPRLLVWFGFVFVIRSTLTFIAEMGEDETINGCCASYIVISCEFG